MGRWVDGRGGAAGGRRTALANRVEDVQRFLMKAEVDILDAAMNAVVLQLPTRTRSP